MSSRYHILVFLFAGLLSFALAGCARSPQVSYHTLASVSQVVPVTAPPTYSVAVAPVTLPELVDRPQLVLTTDSSRVNVLEMHRWAEPLKGAIPRLLAENLSRQLGTDRVSSYPQSASNEADYRVVADFLRFESSGDSVMIETLWTIRTVSGGAGTVHRFKISEAVGGDGTEARVTAYNRALAALSRSIADSLRAEPALSR